MCICVCVCVCVCVAFSDPLFLSLSPWRPGGRVKGRHQQHHTPTLIRQQQAESASLPFGPGGSGSGSLWTASAPGRRQPRRLFSL
ncbi:hypothetical protein Micbo1qcDRAFT_155343, partial [Microdochium bolleyi]